MGAFALLALAGCNQYEMFRLAGYEQASFSNDADIIFVIDNSSSMTDEVEDLALNFAVFIDLLTSTEGGKLPEGSVSDAVDAYILYTRERGRFLDYNLGITTTSVEDPGTDPPGLYGELVGDNQVVDDSFEDISGEFSKNLLCEATCWQSSTVPSDPTYECGDEPDQITLQYLDCVCGLEAWEGNCGSGDEEPLEGAFLSLCRSVEYPPDECYDNTPFTNGDVMTNPNMLRDGATIIFVVVTDEGDGSRRLGQGEYDATPYLELLDLFDKTYRFAVIGPNYDQEVGTLTCNSGGATTWGTERLQQVAEETGGFYNTISQEAAGGDCENTDFAKHLEDLGALLNQLLVSFPLQSVPDIETLLVYVDGEEIRLADEADYTEDGEVICDCWTYDPAENAVMFHGAAIPDYNQTVEIYYKPLEGMPRTLPF
ncbi:MAG TPA: hypothetical protein QGF58_17570 [Myxococcota bacterium]|nr:hypothetical protein [Myxococcota bacterium]